MKNHPLDRALDAMKAREATTTAGPRAPHHIEAVNTIAQEETRRLSVPDMLVTLNKEIHVAHEILSSLESRLGCIMHNRVPTDEDQASKGVAVSHCALGHIVGGMTENARGLIIRMNDILERLQLP